MAHLFPRRVTRRDFLWQSTGALAALRASATEPPPVTVGQGRWKYTMDPDFGYLPPDLSFGFGCGIVIDGRGRIFVSSRSKEPCVAVYAPNSTLMEMWTQDFASRVGYDSPEKVRDTAHGLYWSKQGGTECLYFTENAGRDNPKLGRRIYQTDLSGKVLFTIGAVSKEDSVHRKFEWKNPTNLAIAPNGDIYVVDGYGSQQITRFDRDWQLLQTVGRPTEPKDRGPQAPNDTFSTCHGIWVDTRKADPEIYVADRANRRIQVFSPELEYKRTIAGDDVRHPCGFYQHDGHLYVADLDSVVTIWNEQDECVARLGDGISLTGGGIQASRDLDRTFKNRFFAPHALTVDAQGSLYVVEWVGWGRVRKFRHTPV